MTLYVCMKYDILQNVIKHNVLMVYHAIVINGYLIYKASKYLRGVVHKSKIILNTMIMK